MKLKRLEDLYYFAIVLMLVYDVVLKQSNLNQVINLSIFSNLIWGIIFLCLLAKLFMSKYTLKETRYLFLICCICVTSFVVTKEITLLKFMIFAISIKDVDINKAEKIFLKTGLVLIILILLLVLFKIVPNQPTAVRYGRNRYTLGFSASSFMGFWFFMFFNYYLRKSFTYFKVKQILIEFFLLLILWYVLNCKTSVILIIIINILFVINNKLERIFLLKIWILLPSLFSLISIYVLLNFNNRNKFYHLLDGFLSLRLTYSHEFYVLNGIHLFGKQNTLDYLYVDNSYLALLLRFGIIPLLLILFLYTVAIKKAIERKDTVYVISLISVLIYGLSEMVLFSISINIIIFRVMSEIMNKKSLVNFMEMENKYNENEG